MYQYQQQYPGGRDRRRPLEELQNQQRHQAESEILKRKDEQMKRNLGISELQYRINNINHENIQLMNENQNLRDEIQQIRQQGEQKLSELENNINKQLEYLGNSEQRFSRILMEQKQSNDDEIQQIISQWDMKIQQGEQIYKEHEQQQKELEDILMNRQELLLKLRIDHNESIQMLTLKVQDEENQRSFGSKRQIEMRIKLGEETRDNVIRRNNEIMRELQIRDRQLQEQYMLFENEIAKLQIDNSQLRRNIAECTALADKTKNELLIKAHIIHKLENHITQYTLDLETVKKTHRLDLEHYALEHNNERTIWDHIKESQHLKVLDLEKLNRLAANDIAKIKNDYQRLCDLTQTQVNRIIHDTVNNFKPL